MFDLEQNAVLSAEQWAAISEQLARIARARRERDWALGVGGAKELVETVARIALEARGVPVSNAVKFPKLIHDAHEVLERPAGLGLASDRPSGDIVRQAKAGVTSLAELRAAFGTGHGTALPRDALEEHADLAMDMAVTWARWALRRLAAVADGRYAELIADLNGGRPFSSGDLTRRLLAVNLPTVEPEEQRAIGVAVGRRAAQGTFTVRHEGVEVATPGPRWPLHYRLGVVEGLFVGEDGFVRSDPVAACYVPTLLADAEPEAEAVDRLLGDLLPIVLMSDISYANSSADREAIAASLRQARQLGVPPQIAVLLDSLADKFAPPF